MFSKGSLFFVDLEHAGAPIFLHTLRLDHAGVPRLLSVQRALQHVVCGGLRGLLGAHQRRHYRRHGRKGLLSCDSDARAAESNSRGDRHQNEADRDLQIQGQNDRDDHNAYDRRVVQAEEDRL